MFKTKKSVDTIVSGFQKTIDQLRSHAGDMNTRINDIQVEMDTLAQESLECGVEEDRAVAIANKLSAVIAS